MKCVHKEIIKNRVYLTIEKSYLFGWINIRTIYSASLLDGTEMYFTWVKEPNKTIVYGNLLFQLDTFNALM
jgi:hypothetical protein